MHVWGGSGAPRDWFASSLHWAARVVAAAYLGGPLNQQQPPQPIIEPCSGACTSASIVMTFSLVSSLHRLRCRDTAMVSKSVQKGQDQLRTIVFFHPDLGIGGAERLIIDAAVGLQDLGHKVTVFTSHCDPQHCFEEARDGTTQPFQNPSRLCGLKH